MTLQITCSYIFGRSIRRKGHYIGKHLLCFIRLGALGSNKDGSSSFVAIGGVR
jgi:hypothetical protein